MRKAAIQAPKRLALALLERVMLRPDVPSTSAQVEAGRLMKEDFEQVQVVDVHPGLTWTEARWAENVNEIKRSAEAGDAEHFLRWPAVRVNMVTEFAWSLQNELRYLRRLPDWKTRWKPLLRESSVGSPFRYPVMPSSSGALIHHVYGLALFEAMAGIRASELDGVFEFGGGFGGMCRVFFRAGFNGRYLIYDFPSVCAVQRYYLRSLGYEVVGPGEFADGTAGICCVSDIDALDEALAGIDRSKAALVATWSLSEAPLAMRELLRARMSGFGAYFLAYQKEYGEVDNTDAFAGWTAGHAGVMWKRSHLDHIPENWYLIGRSDTRSAVH